MDKAERFRQLTCTQAVRTDLSGRSIRAATVTAGVSFADFALRIGSSAVLARLVLPEHFGLVMMVSAVTAIADQLRELGLSSATVQRKEITHAEVTNLFWINFGIGTVLAAIVAGLSPLISSYYQDPRLTVVACVLSSTLLFGGLTVQHQALLTRQLRLGHTSSIRLASSILSALLAIGLAAAGYGYWALLWREVARAALLAIGMWIFFPWTPGLPYWKTDVRALVRFGANLTAANFVGTIVGGLDRFLLGRFWGPTPVAMYRQSYQLISSPTDQLLSPLYDVTHPGLSMLQAEPGRYERFYRRILTLVCTITMPLSLFVAVYSKEVTAILLGPRWTDAAPVILVLSLGTFFKQAIGSSVFVVVTRGNARMHLKLTVLQNTVYVAAMCACIPWGAIGFAIADVATVYLLMIPRLYFNLRGSPVSLRAFFATSLRPAIASFGMTVALVGLHTLTPGMKPVLSLALASVAGGIVFAGAWLALPGGTAELAAIISDLRRAFERKRAARLSDETVATAA